MSAFELDEEFNYAGARSADRVSKLRAGTSDVLRACLIELCKLVMRGSRNKSRQNVAIRIVPLSLYYAGLNRRRNSRLVQAESGRSESSQRTAHEVCTEQLNQVPPALATDGHPLEIFRRNSERDLHKRLTSNGSDLTVGDRLATKVVADPRTGGGTPQNHSGRDNYHQLRSLLRLRQVMRNAGQHHICGPRGTCRR